MTKALLVVDVQNDFLPGGALEVPRSEEIIPVINQLINHHFDVIVASKDWHPEDHGSFASIHSKNSGEHVDLQGFDQILWPVHCVQNSNGAEFSEKLDSSKFENVFLKGTDKDIDSYSAFFDNGHMRSTGLGDYLKNKKVTDLYIVGLTTDYCVKYSTLDAAQLGFRTHVIIDGCRAINLSEHDEANAVEEMKNAQAEITTSQEVLNASE